MLPQIAPWIVFALFCAVTWGVTPRRVSAPQFFDGRRDDDRSPGVLMVAMSAALVLGHRLARASCGVRRGRPGVALPPERHCERGGQSDFCRVTAGGDANADVSLRYVELEGAV